MTRARQQSPTCTAPADADPDQVCGRSPTVAHGLCAMHARRWQRNGTTARKSLDPEMTVQRARHAAAVRWGHA